MPWLSVREDIGIDNIDTCVGYAFSKNRRCRNPIPFDDKNLACATLKRMSQIDIQGKKLTDDLLDEDVFEELAEVLLCSLHYWDQKHSLITGWKQRALARERERRLQEMRSSINTVETITTMIEGVSLAGKKTIRERVISSIRGDEEDGSIETPESDAFYASRPSTASSSGRHSTTSHDHYPTSVDSQYSYRSNLLRQQVHNTHHYERKFSSERRSTPPTSGSTPHNSYDNKQSQSLGEIETICPICLDSFEDTHTISRCRGCIKKFHGDCIETWLQRRVETDTSAKCPYCRLEWDEETSTE
ncbi:hypothetical protein BDR22DRAFT_887928 [Usnea florida]